MSLFIFPFGLFAPYFNCLLGLFVFTQAGGASTSAEPPPTDMPEPAASRFRDTLAEEVRVRDTEVLPFLLALYICQPTYVPVYFADPGDNGDDSYSSSHRSHAESAR